MEIWIAEIKSVFKDQQEFSRRDLWNNLKTILPKIADSGIAWRIFTLKEKGIIANTARGRYTLDDKKSFAPLISDTMRSVFTEIVTKFPFTKVCISDTAWMNDFMVHQVFRTILIVEIEKEAALSIFEVISANHQHVFYQPDEQVMKYYMQMADKPIVIKTLPSQSPLVLHDGILIPSLEKLLVDLLAEDTIYASQQTEAEYIYEQARQRHTLHTSRLFRYAKRRNRDPQVLKLMQTTLQND
jgi:hypothetical protein